MPKYILLANFTDQGIRNIRGTISRAEAFQAMAEKSGIVMKELCWTLGRYDVIAVFEAADDESAAALASAPPRSAIRDAKPCAPFPSMR